MPSSFPRAPKLLKGALVSFPGGYMGAVPNVVVFQYNPAEVTRTLSDRVSSRGEGRGGAATEEVHRVRGLPVETLQIEVQLDAADQLEHPASHPQTAALGLHPVLAALETMMYPKSEQLLEIDLLSSLGTVQVAPGGLPLTLLVWGVPRVVPVKITSFSITEQFHDPTLNPIRARVSLGMTVLTSTELADNDLGSGVYKAYHAQKEALALANIANTADQIGGVLPL